MSKKKRTKKVDPIKEDAIFEAEVASEVIKDEEIIEELEPIKYEEPKKVKKKIKEIKSYEVKIKQHTKVLIKEDCKKIIIENIGGGDVLVDDNKLFKGGVIEIEGNEVILYSLSFPVVKITVLG